MCDQHAHPGPPEHREETKPVEATKMVGPLSLVNSRCARFLYTDLPQCGDIHHESHQCAFEALVKPHHNPMKTRKDVNFWNGLLVEFRTFGGAKTMDTPALVEFFKRGDIAYMMKQEDAYLFSYEDADSIEILYEMREMCGMNKDYGLQYLISAEEKYECIFENWKCCTGNCRCRELYARRTHCKSCYEAYTLKVLLNATTHGMALQGTTEDKKKAIRKLRLSKASHQLKFLRNEEIAVMLSKTPVLLTPESVISLRRICGIAGDYGPMEFNTAQSLKDWITGSIDSMWEKLSELCTTLFNKVKKGADMFKEGIKNIWASVSSWFGNIHTAVLDKIKEMVWKVFDFIRVDLKEMTLDFVKKYWKSILASVIAITILFMITSGVLSEGILNIGVSNAEFGNMQAQTYPPMVALTSLLTILYGSLASKISYLGTLMRNVSGIVLGVTALYGIAAGLMTILPHSIQACLTEKFGTEKAKNRLRYDHWRGQALTLLTAAKTARVFTSEFFAKKINELAAESAEILEKELDQQERNDVRVTTMRLLYLISNLVKFYDGKGTKPIPFTIHLAGRPGIGKTTSVKKILQQLDISPERTYDKPPASETWDGFISADAIVMDEFLLNSETAAATVVEYLSLVSSSQFIPKQASVDDPIVGMKGTPCSPKVVLTLNNSTHYVTGIATSSAYFRRRNIVAEFVNNPEWFREKGFPEDGNIDFTQMEKKDIETFSWLRVNVHDPLRPNVVGSYTFIEFVELAKARYAAHNELNVLMGNDFVEGETPEKLFERIYSGYIGLPKGTMTPSTALSNMISKSFDYVLEEQVETGEAQARSVREKIGREHIETYNTLLLMKAKYHSSVERKRLIDEKVSEMKTLEGKIQVLRTYGSIYPEHLVLDNTLIPNETEPEELLAEIIDYAKKNTYLDISDVASDYESAHEACPDPYCTVHYDQSAAEHVGTHDPKTIFSPGVVLVPTPEANRDLWIKSYFQKLGYDISELEYDPEKMHYTVGVKGARCYIKFVENQELIDLAWDAYKANERWSDYLYRTSRNGWNEMKKSGPQIGSVCLIIYVFMLAYVLYKVAQGSDEPEITYYYQAQSARPKKTTQTAGNRKVMKLSEAHAQASGNVKVYTLNVSTGTSSVNVHGVSLGNRALLTVGHVWDTHEESFQVTVKEMSLTFKLKAAEISMVPDVDLSCFVVPNAAFPNTKSIVSRFCSDDTLATIKKTTVSVKIAGDDKILAAHQKNSIPYSSYYDQHYLEYGFYYFVESFIGDCGSPVVCVDNTNASRILGIHVAGGTLGGQRIGITAPVSQETIRLLLGSLSVSADDNVFVQAVGQANVVDNIIGTFDVQKEEQIHISEETKLKKSFLFDFITKTDKQPAVLSATDPRTEWNVDENLIDRWRFSNTAQVDKEILRSCASTMSTRYATLINKDQPERLLTMEEAIRGIPGYMSSLKVKTSAGWPMVKIGKGKGKTACFHFEGEDLIIDPEFRQMVEKRLESMKKGEIPKDRRFLVYLKDELVSEEKVRNARTRAIYANDVISLVAFRMVFGVTLARLNNSWKNTPLAIGVNQYSKDMHVIYQYLAGMSNRFVAGDYKNFDLRYHKDFQKAAYEIFFSLNEVASGNERKYLYAHEAENIMLQFKKKIYQVETMHTSGCFLTTIINCFVNELYMRYCFAMLNPAKAYDQYVRGKFLGDDHILSVKKGCNFNPLEIQAEMEKIGQIYTSDVKTKELTADFRKFDEITFLGAHPTSIRVQGNMMYVGAPKKDILYQTISWTRTKDQDTMDKVEEVMMMSSLWGKKFFSEFQKMVSEGLTNIGIELPEIPGFDECVRVVANRTSGSSEDFFIAQSMRITTLSNVMEDSADKTDDVIEHIPHGLVEKSGECKYVDGALVHRLDIDWEEDLHWYMGFPFGILQEGNQNNVQNMLFDRFRYFSCDWEFEIQVAGSPFCTGLAIVGIIPYNLQLPAGQYHWPTFFTHAKLIPNGAYTVKLSLPFTWLKDVLTSKDQMGGLFIKTISPLTYVEDPKPVKISIYSRTKNVKVYLPETNTLKRTAQTYVNGQRDIIDARAQGDFIEAFAQGNVTSNHVSNEYTIANVAGNVPIGTTTTNKTDATTKNDLEATIPMPLDNPPLMSGSVPVGHAFNSRSKVIGLNVGHRLGMAPEELYRQGIDDFDTSLESYCSRPTVEAKIKWSVIDEVGKTLWRVPLNSLLGTLGDTLGHYIPSCLVPLNSGNFWHADFIFEFYVVRNVFHTGRLRASVAYGVSGYDEDDSTVYKNVVMDFAEGNNSHSVEVPFNAATEYLKIKTNNLFDPDMDMGVINLSVATSLACPATVPQELDVFIFVTAKNVRVRETAPVFAFGHYIGITNDVTEGKAQADFEPYSEGSSEQQQVGVRPNEPVESSTGDVERQKPQRPCTLDVGKHFEYVWTNFLEPARRSSVKRFIFSNSDDFELDFMRHYYREDRRTGLFVFLVSPPAWIRSLYRAWRGSIHYRIHLHHQDSAPIKCCSLSFSPDIYGIHIGVDAWTADGVKIQIGRNNSSFTSASEDLYPLPDGTSYIDVTIPFETQYSVKVTDRKYQHTYNDSGALGTIMIEYQGEESVNRAESITVHQKVGDDFRMSVPWPNCAFRPFNKEHFPEGVGHFRLDGEAERTD